MYGDIPLTYAAPALVTAVTLSEAAWRPGMSQGPVKLLTALSRIVVAATMLASCCTRPSTCTCGVVGSALGVGVAEVVVDIQLDGRAV